MRGDVHKQRVGVREVARLAGVSTQTVSRVLNDYPGIRDETRQRVLDAAAELDYRVNNAARALGTSRTRTVGLVASSASLYGPSAGIAALETAARDRGRWVTTAYADAADAASVSEAVRHVLGQGVDGIVLVAAHASTLDTARSLADGVPLAPLHGVDGPRQADAAASGVAHLASLGHRRIAEVSGPADWLEARARTRGVAAAIDAHGLEFAGRWSGDWTAATGFALAASVASRLVGEDAPTAIAVANDQMALGLIAGLAARGILVPRDVSVIGFDDNPDAAYYRPSLTSVRIDLESESHLAIAEVLGEAQAPAPAAPIVVARDSTAPPGP